MSDFRSGIRDMQRNLSALSKHIDREAKKAVKSEAQSIANRAKTEFVPVDEGNLRDSIHVETLDTNSNMDIISASIIAGGDKAPYAVAVHEHPSDHSPPSWKNTTVTFHPAGHGPKFIERPLRDAEKGMGDRIAEKVFKS